MMQELSMNILDVAENSGIPRIRLGLRQKLDPSWLDRIFSIWERSIARASIWVELTR